MSDAFLGALILAVIFNMWQRILEDRRAAKARLRLSREYAVIIGHVLSMSRMIHCWADHWGDDAEVLKPLLKEAAMVPKYDPDAVKDAF